MTSLSADRKTVLMGAEDQSDPVLLTFQVAASTTIYGGSLVAVNSSGYAVPASATAGLKIVGRCERQVVNQTTGGTTSPNGIATGSAGSINVDVHQGAFYFDANTDGGAFSIASFGANVFAVDDHTVSLSDAGGTRLYAGYVLDGGGIMAPPGQTSQIGIMVAKANPFANNPELATSTAFKARAVVTTLQAYGGSGTNVLTETSNGAISAADGVTLAVGDVVFIQGGTTNLTAAKDSGPWTVTALGGASAKWTLTRPDWFTTGATVPQAAKITIGGEGTIWAGTTWTSYVGFNASNVIGTNDPSFYVDMVVLQASLVSSSTTVSTVGIRSASASSVQAELVTTGGTTTSTIGYGTIAALTPGYIGTASATVVAIASGMSKNGTADTSTLNITIVNN